MSKRRARAMAKTAEGGGEEKNLTSVATKWTLACPCFPVLEVDMSMIYVEQRAVLVSSHTPKDHRRSSCAAWAPGSRVQARGRPSSAPSRRPFPDRRRSRQRDRGVYLAGVTLDDNVSTLAEGRALLGVGEGGSSRDGLEGLLVLLVVVGLTDRQKLRVSTDIQSRSPARGLRRAHGLSLGGKKNGSEGLGRQRCESARERGGSSVRPRCQTW